MIQFVFQKKKFDLIRFVLQFEEKTWFDSVRFTISGKILIRFGSFYFWTEKVDSVRFVLLLNGKIWFGSVRLTIFWRRVERSRRKSKSNEVERRKSYFTKVEPIPSIHYGFPSKQKILNEKILFSSVRLTFERKNFIRFGSSYFWTEKFDSVRFVLLLNGKIWFGSVCLTFERKNFIRFGSSYIFPKTSRTKSNKVEFERSKSYFIKVEPIPNPPQHW